MDSGWVLALILDSFKLILTTGSYDDHLGIQLNELFAQSFSNTTASSCDQNNFASEIWVASHEFKVSIEVIQDYRAYE